MNDEQVELLLGDLAACLAVGPSVTPTVLDQIDARRHRRLRTQRRLSLAAAFIAVVVTGLLVSGAATSVARWLGLDGLTLRFNDDLPSGSAPVLLPAPGTTTVVEVDGRRIAVSIIEGSLSAPLLTKTIGAGTEVEAVFVEGRQGLWIAGAPHEVVFLGPDGQIMVQRMAGNTLLWEGDGSLYRVEGFGDRDAAVEFAGSLAPG